MKTISISQLRGILKKYLDEVIKSSQAILVPGTSEEDDVVILSFKEYKSLTDTGHLISTPTNRQRLLESLAQLREGKTRKFNA